MRIIDGLKTQDLVRHLFDTGEAERNEFQEDFSGQALQICEHLRNAYAGFLRFDNYRERDEQFLFVTAHVYSLIESLFTSTKLLALGFIAPSGNQFRHAMEAAAMAVLISWRGTLLMQKGGGKWREGNFFGEFLKGDNRAQSHHAIRILQKNRERIGLSEQALATFNSIKRLYDQYSHVSPLSIRALIRDSSSTFFGGGYDRAQKELFAKELHIRLTVINLIPSLIDSLFDRAVSQVGAYQIGADRR